MVRRLEEGLASGALAAMVLLPLIQLVARAFGGHVPGAMPIVQHLMLWVAFLGAALAARDGKLLSFATGKLMPEGRVRDAANVFSSAVAAGVAALLAYVGVELVLIERQAETMIAGFLPIWMAQLVMPVAFALIALRLVWRAGPGWWTRPLAGLGIVAGGSRPSSRRGRAGPDC